MIVRKDKAMAVFGKWKSLWEDITGKGKKENRHEH